MHPIAIYPEGQPAPAGHYAPGVRHGDLLFISGQLPGPGDPPSVAADIAAQATAAMSALLRVVSAAGGTPADLVKITVYLVGIDHWTAFDTACRTMLGDARPARAIVPVPALHHGYLVEIDGIAALRGG